MICSQPMPEIVQPLVDRFGVVRVNLAWLAVKGFPATWAPSLKDTLEVQEYLESHV